MLCIEESQPDVLANDKPAPACGIRIKFTITYEMAPISRLLVYYVRPNGEGVTDAIVFTVEPSFRNWVNNFITIIIVIVIILLLLLLSLVLYAINY